MHNIINMYIRFIHNILLLYDDQKKKQNDEYNKNWCTPCVRNKGY